MARVKRRGRRRRSPHSRRLSCSPSAYHSVTGQDLYVEFIVAESALLRFMDVFRRSAAVRVIYRSALTPFPLLLLSLLLPSILFSLSLSLSPFLFPPVYLSTTLTLLPDLSVLCSDSADGGGGPEGSLMNATTESLLSFPIYIYIYIYIYTYIHLPLFPSQSFFPDS